MLFRNYHGLQTKNNVSPCHCSTDHETVSDVCCFEILFEAKDICSISVSPLDDPIDLYTGCIKPQYSVKYKIRLYVLVKEGGDACIMDMQ